MPPAIHHVAYVVADLGRGVAHWERTLGAGPFKLLERPQFDAVTSQGEPGVYLHSAAFGMWGDIAVELVELHEVAPARAAEAFAHELPWLHHVAWTVPDLAQGSADLEAQGFPEVLTCLLGEIQHAFHDARAVLGHHIELHRDCAMLADFWAEAGKR